jgi:hypothetical protein
MKVEIEEYRGWTISFDTEQETFYCHSEQWDRDENRKSFAATKKWIDDFIKENQTFKPVWVEKKPNSYGSYSRVKLIGIRKDGRFVYEDEKGDKKQLSEYDEKYYILYDERNDKIKEEAEKIASEIKLLRKKEEEILSSIVGISLSEYKKQLDL